ncbi:MAG: hypothetical protein SFY96_07225 [Planctomycetota bacterium]|nr:hypothetical protein [Planctomycetota bacterium]
MPTTPTTTLNIARTFRTSSLLLLVATLSTATAQPSDPSTTTPAPKPAKPATTATKAAPAEEVNAESVVAEMQRHAKAIEPLLRTDLAKQFVTATEVLPLPPTRTVYRNRVKGVAYTQAQFDALPESEREGLVEKVCDPLFYYYTGYGTPLAYARPFDLLGEAGLTTIAGKRVLDFGYGSIGHLRLLASCGADAHGIEVNPIFVAMYAQPDDQGAIANARKDGERGQITLHHGSWPGTASLSTEVGEAYDLFISKNVLKRGYIHPARETDPRFLINLGVDDAAFLSNVHRVLKPGGVFMIYNISPKQNPDDQPYLPHADGRCAFDRAAIEHAGFEIIAYDRDDSAAVCEQWLRFGYDDGKGLEHLKETTFAWVTIARKK